MATARPISDEDLRFYVGQVEGGKTRIAACKALKERSPSRWAGIKLMSMRTMIGAELTERAELVRAIATIPEPITTFPDELPETWIDYEPLLLHLADLHHPLHNQELLGHAVRTVQALGIEQGLYGGDIFDNAHKGYKGYRTVRAAQFTAGLFTAREVGAPHYRRRLFWLGHANGTRLERWGQPKHEGCDQRVAWPPGPKVGPEQWPPLSPEPAILR